MVVDYRSEQSYILLLVAWSNGGFSKQSTRFGAQDDVVLWDNKRGSATSCGTDNVVYGKQLSAP